MKDLTLLSQPPWSQYLYEMKDLTLLIQSPGPECLQEMKDLTLPIQSPGSQCLKEINERLKNTSNLIPLAKYKKWMNISDQQWQQIITWNNLKTLLKSNGQ